MRTIPIRMPTRTILREPPPKSKGGRRIKTESLTQSGQGMHGRHCVREESQEAGSGAQNAQIRRQR